LEYSLPIHQANIATFIAMVDGYINDEILPNFTKVQASKQPRKGGQ
jgi:hypothetical protein